MPTFLTFSDISLFQVFIAKGAGLNLVKSITEADFLKEKAGLKRETLSSWSRLRAVLNPEADLFGGGFEDGSEGDFEGDSEVKAKIYLLDYQDLDLEEKSLEFLSGFFKQNQDLEVYLYSSTNQTGKFLADQKKEFKKAGFEVLELNKVEDNLVEQVLDQSIEKAELEGFKISNYKKDLQKLAKQATNYFQIIDMLDMLSLAQDDLKKEVLRGFEVQDAPLLFMLGFNLKNLEKDVLKWHSLIGEGELQLALSLILGKLEKQAGEVGQKQVLAELVLVDQRTKTLNVDMLLFWKYFLWKAKWLVRG